MTTRIVTTRKVKNVRGRIEGYAAEFRGRFESPVCQTAAEAVALTSAAMIRQAEHLTARRYFFAADNKTVYCLFYEDGWTVDIISPDRSCSCSWLCGRDGTQAEQINRIREHLTKVYGGILREM